MQTAEHNVLQQPRIAVYRLMDCFDSVLSNPALGDSQPNSRRFKLGLDPGLALYNFLGFGLPLRFGFRTDRDQEHLLEVRDLRRISIAGLIDATYLSNWRERNKVSNPDRDGNN